MYLYYNDETPRTVGKSLECGDLSPLLPLWRLVAKAGPRPAARESWTPFRIGRRQVACLKRGQVRALQSGCGSAALGSSVSIRGFNYSLRFQQLRPALPCTAVAIVLTLCNTAFAAAGSGTLRPKFLSNATTSCSASP